MFDSIFKTIVSGLTSIAFFVGSIFGIYEPNIARQEPKTVPQQTKQQEVKQENELPEYLIEAFNKLEQELGAVETRTAGLASYFLGGGGVASTDVSFTLTSFTLPQTGYEIQDGDLSDIFYLTLEPGNRSRQEFISCTTVSQSGADSTATISGCVRGLSPIAPYTASTTLRFSHAGGTQVIISDPPQLFNNVPFKNNDEYITGLWQFGSTSPMLNPNATATSTNQLATRGYAEGLANAGAATSTESNGGIVELATRTEVASTTDSTSGIKPLVVQSEHATSSPGRNITNAGGTGETYIVVSRDDGTIDPNFIATSTPSIYASNINTPPRYQFGGEVNTSTSTIGSLSVGTLHATSTIYTARGNSYTWPLISPPSTTTLVSNSSGVQFWDTGPVKLFDDSLEVASSTWGTYDFEAKNGLRVVLQTTGLASAGTYSISFNRDGGANYYSRDYTATGRAGFVFQNESLGGTGISLVSQSTTSPVTLDFFIPNISGTQKTFGWSGALGNASAIPMPHNGAGTWQNTSAQITQVTISSGANINANSRLQVFGY